MPQFNHLKNTVALLLLLIILNIVVPFLLGVFFVFLFNQSPEFSIIGSIIGLITIQVYFAIIYFTYKLRKKIAIGLFVFIISFLLSPFFREIEIISNILFKLFPEDTVSNKLLKALSIASAIAFLLWIMILFFTNAKKQRCSWRLS